MVDEKLNIGAITTRKCPTCGHHEVGYIASDGVFHSFKEGDFVQVLERSASYDSPAMQEVLPNAEIRSHEEIPDHMVVWVPEPLRTDKQFRCRYGVFYDRELAGGEMSSAVYEIAYKQKIRHLIEKEIYTPLPVILDQFFGAPNLATGEPEEIAQVLWDELEEIRRPAGYVCDWIDNQNEENLARMIKPRSVEKIKNDAASDEQIKQELIDMTLEDFFEMLLQDV